MSNEPIPDLLAELRAGSYPHDFVVPLAGDSDHRRRQMLAVLLATPDAGARVRG